MHLLCGPVAASQLADVEPYSAEAGVDLVERVAELERLVAQLQDAVTALQAAEPDVAEPDASS
jgi:uncharacterized protein YceH (UPF0502 family)